MPILLYCISKHDVHTSDSLSGVAGDPVVRVEIGELAAFSSNNADSGIWLKSPLRDSALEFHRVIGEIFKSAAVIPFRFPTIFGGEDELRQHLKERADEYNSALEKFANDVQMEVRIANHRPEVSAQSGTNYLRQKQSALRANEEFAGEIERILFPLAKDWRKRTSKEGIRAFALIARGNVKAFEDAMRQISIPDRLQVRVSGPWPVSEFLGFRL